MPNNLIMMDGTGTKFTQELIEGDVLTLSTGDLVQVNRIANDNYLTFYVPPVNPRLAQVLPFKLGPLMSQTSGEVTIPSPHI